jgi:hypothetical protein
MPVAAAVAAAKGATDAKKKGRKVEAGRDVAFIVDEFKGFVSQCFGQQSLLIFNTSLQGYLDLNDELDAPEVLTDANGYIIEEQVKRPVDPDSLTSEFKVLESLSEAYEEECDLQESRYETSVKNLDQQIMEQKAVIGQLEHAREAAGNSYAALKDNMEQNYDSTVKDVRLRRLKSLNSSTRNQGKYLKLGYTITPILESAPWEALICIAIILGSLLQGVETYYPDPEHPTRTLISQIDLCILGIFVLEFALRVITYGLEPLVYFTEFDSVMTWNNFDFAILISLFVSLGMPDVKMGVVRLCRLAKLVKFSKSLNVIMQGLLQGLKSVGFLLLLLILIFYLYAIIGIVMFAETDPFHFRGLGYAFLTLFQLTLLSGWNDIFMISFDGCEVYPGAYEGACDFNETLGYMIRDPTAACSKLPVLTLDSDVTAEQCLAMETTGFTQCTCGGAGKPLFATLYFLSFVMLVSMVMLAMVVSAMTVGMAQAVAALNSSEEAWRSAKLIESSKEEWGMCLETIITEESKDEEIIIQWQRAKIIIDKIWMGRDGNINTIIDEIFGLQLMKIPPIIDDDDLIDTRGFFAKCRMLSMSQGFNGFMCGTTIMACLLVGLQTDPAMNNALHIETSQKVLFSILESGAAVAFTIEAFVRICAEAPIFYVYFQSGWNVLDFTVVCLSWIEFNDPGAFPFPAAVLRLLRGLRVIKLAHSLPQLKLAVESIVNAGGSLGWTAVILIVFFYFCALLALEMFQESDAYHFGSLHRALVTCFRLATMDDWESVLFTNVYGCATAAPNLASYSVDPKFCPPNSYEPSTAHGILAYCFIITYIFFGGLILMNLFIGIICSSMDEANTQAMHDEQQNGQLGKVEAKFKKYMSRNFHKEMTKAFALLDMGGDGSITKDEIRFFLTLGYVASSSIPPSTAHPSAHHSARANPCAFCWCRFQYVKLSYAKSKGENEGAAKRQSVAKNLSSEDALLMLQATIAHSDNDGRSSPDCDAGNLAQPARVFMSHRKLQEVEEEVIYKICDQVSDYLFLLADEDMDFEFHFGEFLELALTVSTSEMTFGGVMHPRRSVD